MLSSPAIAQVPEILWFQVFKYVDIRDFVQLKAVSQKMAALTEHYAEIYERECLRIFASPLELYMYGLRILR
jgi:hypothetical protein